MGDETDSDGKQRFNTGGGLSIAAALTESSPERLIGSEFNGYRLTDLLGHGGMGTVFRAERADGEFERSVALKVVTNALAFARFQRERDIHAQLNHPNIARFYDAGTSLAGVPYIIMELVPGEAIDTYCQSRNLSLKCRMALLIKIVEAVAYAHANLVVHRDIKPSNILIDEAAVPKLLDFGIAKFTADEGSELTATSRPLTPVYASPEQVLGQPVSIASDIYQLGALIAQICTDKPPFNDTTLAGTISRAEQDFAPLQPEVKRLLPADLLAVVMRCLAPDPGRRYTDANALAAELIRFQGGFPVLAKNPGAWQRAQKLVRRHPLAATATLLTVVAALSGNYWYTKQLTQSNARAQIAANEAVAQRNQAEAEVEINRQVTQFLIGLFKSSDPLSGDPEDFTAAQLLDRGVVNIGALDNQPHVQSALKHTMGEVYVTTGRYAEAIPLLQDALQDSSSFSQRVRISITLANAYREMHDYQPGLVLLEPLVAELDRNPALASQQDYYAARYQLVLLYTGAGSYDKAPALLDRLIAEADLVSMDQHINTLLEQASLTNKLGDWEAAEQLYQQAIELELAHNGPESYKMGKIYQNLGNLYQFRQRLTEAKSTYLSALASLEAVYGPQHPLVGGALGSLGTVAWKRDELDEAAGYFQRAVDILAASVGPDHPDTAKGYGAMGLIFLDLGELDKALAAMQRTNAIFEQHYEPESIDLSTSRSFLAKAYQAKGEHSKAEELFNQALEVRQKLLPADNLSILDTAHALLITLRAQNKFAEADALESEIDFTPLNEALARTHE
ncbi:MAG: tetratricopeptide repeat-containing serine/threonine protein kinase [Pseudomonadaceae bacterium]|nr:tetratricopeptide repeat-containing serine/threonine protein kinase [Pseudomonadaceae bacterium]